MSSSIPSLRHGVTAPLLTVVASGATLVLLGACGGGGGGIRDEGVASIATSSAHAATTADPDTGHVRIRLDMGLPKFDEDRVQCQVKPFRNGG
ncbi:hypothetical protein [Streptomyces sp. NBC_01518]|uniref:hypothetical protein n=1 Tax=Streptomyces sp. NBC_01518 TaxID=2903891 RepID=UPI0038651C00